MRQERRRGWQESLFRLLVIGIWERSRGRATVCAGGNGSLETGDELRDVRLVKVLDGILEFVTLLPVTQQLYDLLTSFDVLRFCLSHTTLLPRLCFRTGRLKSVLGPFSLVLLEGLFGLAVPRLALVVGEVLPGHTDDLAQGTVVCLDS